MAKQTLKFGAGQVTDRARHRLPAQAVWSALDLFLQEDDTLAKRGAAITALAAGSAISPSAVALLDSGEIDNVLKLIAFDDSNGVAGNIRYAAATPGAGTMTLSGILSSTDGGLATAMGGGRPARYMNRILRPNGIADSPTVGYYPFAMYGGADLVNTNRTSANAITVTAGDNLTTGWVALDTASMEVGGFVKIAKSGTNCYIGRVIEIPSTSTVRVSPTPATSFVGTAGLSLFSSIYGSPALSVASTYVNGARCLTAWSDRVVLGGTSYDLLGGHAKLDIRPNEIAWGLLPVAVAGENVIGGVTWDGIFEGSPFTFLVKDAFKIPAIETIIGLEPVNQGELLVLAYPRCHRIVGFFATQTVQAGGGLTFEARPLQDAVAAVSDLATATTPIGIFFAGTDGIYLYRDGRATNVMDKRIKNEWYAALQGGATVTGGGYLNNHTYYVSLTDRVYVLDFDQFRWSRWNMNTIGQSVFDPTRPGRVYGFRRNPGTTSNTSKIFRLDTTLSPSNANRTDAQASWGGPSPTLLSQAYTFNGDDEQLKRFQHVWVTVRMPGSGTLTVTALPGLDSEEPSVTLGTISAATSAQTVHFPCSINSRALAIQIALTSGSPDEVEIVSVKVQAAPLSEYRAA